MPAALEVDVPPDALLLARALARRSLPVLVRAQGGTVTYLAWDPVAVSRELDPEPALLPAQCEHGEIPRWFGLLPYEARRSLERSPRPDRRAAPHLVDPLWRRYGLVVKISNKVEIFSGSVDVASRCAFELVTAIETLPGSPVPPKLRLRTPVEPGALHRARIERALELIRAGDIYQVNLARRFELAVEGRAAELLFALCGGQLPSHGAACDWPEVSIAAASPELFLASDVDGRAWTAPIKGTRPRSDDPVRDAELARALDQDPKERAELAMIIDVERNDLGRLAEAGSVRLVEAPVVQSHPTVHHRVACVEAQLRPEVTRAELLSAMLPSGSVTGAPKVRAMEVIAELEPWRRGLYTGAFGVLRNDGTLELGMAIRTLSVRDGVGHYFAGGGIVADSVPERELEETLWKARPLMNLAGAAENWAGEANFPK